MPDNEPASADAAPPGAPSIGERLRAAREQRGLSIDQLAEYVRLDESVVAALEADDFDALGAPVFVRGHLKTSARFLEIDVDELLGDYDAAAPEPVVRPPAAGQASGVPITINLVPWGAGALGVLMAIGLTIYLLQDDRADAPESSAMEIAPSAGGVEPLATGTLELPEDPAPPAAFEPSVAEETPSFVERELSDEPPAVAMQPEPAIDAEAEPVAQPTPAEPAPVGVAAAEPESEPEASAQQTLTLYFRGESWTEISDRNGRLLFGLQREGIRRELSGEAPFKLLLGNAPAVDLYVNDEPYDLPAGSTRGKVARFVIEPGSGQSLP